MLSNCSWRAALKRGTVLCRHQLTCDPARLVCLSTTPLRHTHVPYAVQCPHQGRLLTNQLTLRGHLHILQSESLTHTCPLPPPLPLPYCGAPFHEGHLYPTGMYRVIHAHSNCKAHLPYLCPHVLTDTAATSSSPGLRFNGVLRFPPRPGAAAAPHPNRAATVQ